MSDTDSESCRTTILKIPRFHGRRGENYSLWRLRLRAACRIKGVWDLVTEEASSSSSAASSRSTTITDADKRKLTTKLEKVSGMIISALGDSPLRVVADADGDPARMLRLLDARYASDRTVSRIAVQTQLYRMRYTGQDMSRYIDDYATLFGQLEFMGKDVAIPDAHKAPMLLASVDPSSDMESISAALRTKDANELTWEYVTTTMIDEYNARHKLKPMSNKKGRRKSRRKLRRHQLASATDDDDSSIDESIDEKRATRVLAAALHGTKKRSQKSRSEIMCEFCTKHGHIESQCYLNPENPNNRLPAKMKERMMMADCLNRNNNNKRESASKGRETKTELAGIILFGKALKVERTTLNPPKDFRTYYDSGATSHVFHSEDAFIPGSLHECDPRTVLLADKSFVKASRCGEVILPFEHVSIRLRSALLIPGLEYNLVSVGCLADNGIESIFREKDVILRHITGNPSIGYGTRDDGTRLYSLPSPNYATLTMLTAENETSLLHRRFAHINMDDVCNVHKHANGIPKLRMKSEVCRARSTGTLQVRHNNLGDFAQVTSHIKELHSDQATEYLRLDNDLEEGIQKSYLPPHARAKWQYQVGQLNAEKGVVLEILDYGVSRLLTKDERGMYSIFESNNVNFDKSYFLGKGGFEKLFQLWHKSSMCIYAMKAMEKDGRAKRKAVQDGHKERNILAYAMLGERNAPFIVRHHVAFRALKCVYLVMDVAICGELMFHLRQKAMLGEEAGIFYATELLIAIEAMHSMNICHKDIKPGNLLLDGEKHVILTDFGVAKEVNGSSEEDHSWCGSEDYMALEALARKSHAEKPADYWAFGVCLYDCLYGEPLLSLLREKGKITGMELQFELAPSVIHHDNASRKGSPDGLQDTLQSSLPTPVFTDESDPEERLAAKVAKFSIDPAQAIEITGRDSANVDIKTAFSQRCAERGRMDEIAPQCPRNIIANIHPERHLSAWHRYPARKYLPSGSC